MLELQHINISFRKGLIGRGSKPVLEDVSLNISKGELVSIIGFSGSGKTTLARIAVRSINPDRGKIILDGQDISKLGFKDMSKYRSRLQMVFQHPEGALNPEMTLGDSLREAVRKAGYSGKAFEEKLDSICLELEIKKELLNRYPMQVSGGEIQRVALARALTFDPDYIFMDEPTSMLDASVQAQILKVIISRKERMGMGIVLVTHDLDIVRSVSDRVIAIDKGRIVAEGTAEEVFSSQIPYIKDYVDSWNELESINRNIGLSEKTL